jgi:hypothetical protein
VEEAASEGEKRMDQMESCAHVVRVGMLQNWMDKQRLLCAEMVVLGGAAEK